MSMLLKIKKRPNSFVMNQSWKDIRKKIEFSIKLLSKQSKVIVDIQNQINLISKAFEQSNLVDVETQCQKLFEMLPQWSSTRQLLQNFIAQLRGQKLQELTQSNSDELQDELQQQYQVNEAHQENQVDMVTMPQKQTHQFNCSQFVSEDLVPKWWECVINEIEHNPNSIPLMLQQLLPHIKYEQVMHDSEGMHKLVSDQQYIIFQLRSKLFVLSKKNSYYENLFRGNNQIQLIQKQNTLIYQLRQQVRNLKQSVAKSNSLTNLNQQQSQDAVLQIIECHTLISDMQHKFSDQLSEWQRNKSLQFEIIEKSMKNEQLTIQQNQESTNQISQKNIKIVQMEQQICSLKQSVNLIVQKKVNQSKQIEQFRSGCVSKNIYQNICEQRSNLVLLQSKFSATLVSTFDLIQNKVWNATSRNKNIIYEQHKFIERCAMQMSQMQQTYGQQQNVFKNKIKNREQFIDELQNQQFSYKVQLHNCDSRAKQHMMNYQQQCKQNLIIEAQNKLLQDELQKSGIESQLLVNDNRSLLKRLETEDSNIKLFKTQISELHQQNVNQNSEIIDKQKQLTYSVQQNEQKKDQILLLQQNLMEKEDTIVQNQIQQCNLEASIQNLTNENKKLATNIQDLQGMNTNLICELKQSKLELAKQNELSSINNKLQNEICNLQAVVQSKDKQMKDFEAQTSNFIEQNKQNEESICSLKQQVENLRSQVQSAPVTISNLQKLLFESNQQFEQLNRDNKQLTEQLSQHKQQMSDLLIQQNEKDDQTEQFKQKYNILCLNSAIIQKENEKNCQRILSLQEENQDLKQKVVTLEVQIKMSQLDEE